MTHFFKRSFKRSNIDQSPTDLTVEVAAEVVDSETSTKTQRIPPQRRGWWRTWNLRQKAMALALAIGVLPVAAIGGIAYTLISRSMTAQITAEQENQLLAIRSDISLVINRFVEDAEAIAKSSLLTDPELIKMASLAQKSDLLNGLIEASSSRYRHVAVFNLEGTLLFQSNSSTPLHYAEDYRKRQHFQQAVATQSSRVNNPSEAVSSGADYLEVATPIKQSETGELLGIVMIQMPSKHLDELFDYVQASGEYQLVGGDGRIFAATEPDLIGHPIETDLGGLTKTWVEVVKKNLLLSQVVMDINDQENFLVSLTTITNLEGIPNSGWGLSISRPTALAFAPLNELCQILLIGTCSTGLLVGAIIASLTLRATSSRPPTR